MKKSLIYKGLTIAGITYVGTDFKRNITVDRFGKLYEGQTRCCYVSTKWGQLRVPMKFMNRKITITVEEITGD
jgi:hypothetical protein